MEVRQRLHNLDSCS